MARGFRAPEGSHMCEIFFCDMKRERYCCMYCNDRKRCTNPCLNSPEKCESHFIQGQDHELREMCKIYQSKRKEGK